VRDGPPDFAAGGMSEAHAKLRQMTIESTALVLSERLDALAAALQAARVSPEQSASLLASAAAATMHALTLDALLEKQSRPAAAPDRRAAATSFGTALVPLAA
jgi:hypothetical protein